MSKKLIGAIFVTFFIVGCATSPTYNDVESVNDYSTFYKPTPGIDFATIAATRANPPPDAPEVEHVPRSETAAVLAAYIRKGYVLVGQSSFTSGHQESDQDAIDVATNVGADLVVILTPHYVGTAGTDVPVTVPTTTTSYTTGTAVGYGDTAPGVAYANSTTTTYGSRTMYMPMAAPRYVYGAGYFVKRHYLLVACNIHL